MTLLNFNDSKEQAFMTSMSKGSRTWNGDLDAGKNIAEFGNIDAGISPMENTSNLKIVDAIKLCEKAYHNVAIFRQTIDIQSQFANSSIRFFGKNKKSVKFFTKWYEKINGWNLASMFFREWFRSGNVFLYKMVGKLDLGDLKKMSRTDAAVAIAKAPQIPLKYVLIRPTEVRYDDSASLLGTSYYRLLNKETVKRLKRRLTDIDKSVYNSLTKVQQQAVDKEQDIQVELTPDKFICVFCNKQDYEPMSVPMYYPVLNDINLKLQFKAAEQVIARTVDYATLLITAGEKERSAGDTYETLRLINELYSSESVGRVLVADYTVKGEWLIPNLNEIFGPQKYEVVDRDISNGLMNIFYGEEKFANSMIKIQVFLELLKHAREAYINFFLKPEMKIIADELGLSDVPDVSFEEINLKSETEYFKIFTRLYELGLLTPEETIDAFKTYRLPEIMDSEESQRAYKKLKDEGLYSPQAADKALNNGRPTGSTAPQSSKNVAPIGTGSKNFSLNKIVENIKEFNDLKEIVENQYKETKGLKRLSKAHKDICEKISEDIIIQEEKPKWIESIQKYIANPIQLSVNENSTAVAEISSEHGISYKLAAILKLSAA